MEEYLIWNEFGNIHLGTASYDEAIQAYSKAIELAPNFGWPYRNLASAYISKGRFAEAIPLLLKSIDLLTSRTDQAISFNKLGDAYRNLGNYQAALDAYQQADALSAIENLDWTAPAAPEAQTDPDQAEPDPAERLDAVEPQLEASAVSEPEVPEVAKDTVAVEAAAEEVVPQPEAFDESGLPDITAEAEEAEPQVEASFEGRLSVASEDSPAPDALSEQADEFVSEAIEDPDESGTEDLAQAASPETSGESASGSGEPQPEEAAAPFILEDSHPESFEGNQQNGAFNLVALSSSSFDVPVTSTGVDKKNGHRYELDVEETELPEWLEEHVTTPETEDFSDYKLWQPLTIKEQLVNDRGSGFNFVELPGDPITGDDLPEPEADPIAESEIFSNFAPEPLQASTSMDFIDRIPGLSIEMEKGDPEEDVLAEPPSSTMPEMLSADEVGRPAADEAPVEEPAVTTSELNPAGINDLTHKSEEDLKQSVSIYKKITDINPTNDRAWHTLGELYKSLHRYDEAIEAYEKAISLNAEKDIYHYHLGLVYATKKRNTEASRSFQKVLIINPEHVLAHCALAGSYRRLGLEDEAMEHLTIVEPIIQSETEYNRACFQAISENADEAIRLLKIALEKKQTSLDWALRDPDLDNIREDPRFMETIMSQEILPEA